MSRSRLISLGLPAAIAAVALSAVVLAPALAEEPKKCEIASPTHWVFCYSTKEEMGKPVQKASGTGGAAVLAATIGAAEANFECESNGFVVELESSGKGKGTITLHKCKETSPEHCKLTAAEEKEIELPFTEALAGKLEKPGKPKAVFTGAGAGEEFGSLEIEHATNECPITAGKYKVTGKQNAELPKAEESLAEHEVVIKKSGSELKIGGNEASLSGTDKVKLLTPHEGAAWYVGLGT